MKKFCLVLAILMLFAAVVPIYANAEEPDFPCGGAIELVDVKILYSPITSRIVLGKSDPKIEGTVLKITYPDGSNEILKVKKDGNRYCAGNFSGTIFDFCANGKENRCNYGIVCKTVSFSCYKAFGGYEGDADFVYLCIPKLSEIINV